MKSFHDIFTHIDKVCDFLGNRYSEDLWALQPQLNRVLEMPGDEQSKRVYCQEIVMCTLKNFLNGDKASTYAGFMSKRQWQRRARTGQSGEVPNYLK